MTINIDDRQLPDDVPVADVLEQQQAIDVDAEECLDRDHLADPLQRDANTVDLIDQAVIVPWPDDDRGGDTTS